MRKIQADHLETIEQRLRAARPDIGSGAPGSGPPPLAAVLARIEQDELRGRAKPRRWRWRRSRTVLPAALAVTVLAGAGGGALLLTSGRALPPAFLLPANPQTGLGQPVPASLALLPMRVPDPDGGPPWGMRVIHTTRGLVCLQAGRVVEERLGAIGSGYAFDGDGLFHPYMAADAIGVDACPTADGAGLAFIPGQAQIVTANGLPLAGENLWPGERVHCDLPDEQNWGVRCPQPELRQVAMGLLGPDATIIQVSSPEGESTVKPYGPDGAYLIVLPAQPDANTSMQRAPGGALLTVTYDDGSTCEIPSRDPQETCEPKGFPASAPLPSSAEVSAPVSVRYLPSVSTHSPGDLLAYARSSDPNESRIFMGNKRIVGARGARDEHRPPRHEVRASSARSSSGALIHGQIEREPGPALAVSFQARVAAENESSGYVVELRPAEVTGCETPSLIVSQPTQQTIKAGETVEMTVPLEDGCATSYTGRVFFAESTPDLVAGTSHGEEEGPLYEVVGSQFGGGQHALTFPTVATLQVSVPEASPAASGGSRGESETSTVAEPTTSTSPSLPTGTTPSSP